MLGREHDDENDDKAKLHLNVKQHFMQTTRIPSEKNTNNIHKIMRGCIAVPHFHEWSGLDDDNSGGMEHENKKEIVERKGERFERCKKAKRKWIALYYCPGRTRIHDHHRIYDCNVYLHLLLRDWNGMELELLCKFPSTQMLSSSSSKQVCYEQSM